MPGDELKVALFTDTYDEINGVGNTYRHLAEYCTKRGKALDIFTYTRGRSVVEERGSVTISRLRPNIPVKVYSDLIFDAAVPLPELGVAIFILVSS